MRVMFIGGPLHAQRLELPEPLPDTYDVRDAPLDWNGIGDVTTYKRIESSTFSRRPRAVYVIEDQVADIERLARLWRDEVDE